MICNQDVIDEGTHPASTENRRPYCSFPDGARYVTRRANITETGFARDLVSRGKCSWACMYAETDMCTCECGNTFECWHGGLTEDSWQPRSVHRIPGKRIRSCAKPPSHG